MEMRLQPRLAKVVSLKIYEGTLSPSQRDALLLVLNDVGIKRLPDSELPHIPTTSSRVNGVKVEIQRDKSVQRIAYAEWSQKQLTWEGASSKEIEHQKRTKAALQKLMDWFHQLQDSGLKEAKVASTLCGQ